MKKIIIINTVALVFIAVGCFFFMKEAQSKNEDSASKKIHGDAYSAHRLIDYEAEVACYICSNGISCLPLSQTKLPSRR
jgi:hypothetical protein